MGTFIVYAERSGAPRRILTNATDADASSQLLPGERMILWTDTDIENVGGLAGYADFLASALGLPVLPSSRCCALDDNLTVIAVCMADPLLDVFEGSSLLVQDDDAQIGWQLQSDGTWLQP